MQLLKCIFIGLFGLCLTACAGSRGNTPVRASSVLVSHMSSSTVALVIRNSEGLNRVYCTGVWIREDIILTANHCVAAAARMNNNSEAEVDPMGEKISYIVEKEANGFMEEPSAVHLGQVAASDDDHDLALVKVKLGGMPAHEIVKLVKEMPGLGEHVYMVGHVKGLWWSFIEGVVSAYRKGLPFIDKGGPFVQVSGPVYFGNSGGGLFDSSGDLVGICSFMALAPQTNFYIHADSIKKFLTRNL